jgi:hypothetical protein
VPVSRQLQRPNARVFGEKCAILFGTARAVRLDVLSAIFLATLLSLPAAANDDPDFEHIRTASRNVRELVDLVASRSPTFANLLQRLDRTNVAVYLQFVADLPTPRHGQLHFIGASEEFRFVRVQVKAGLPLDQLASILGHELRHALEIGESPEVDCDESMEELYRRIGKRQSPRQFETSEAAETGRKVREELLGS